jgi:hypothetical protein
MSTLDTRITEIAHDMRVDIGDNPTIDEAEELAQRLVREGDTDIAACVDCPVACLGPRNTIATANLILDLRTKFPRALHS